MRDQGPIRVSTRMQVAMGGVLAALGVVMGTTLPVSDDARTTLLAGLAGLGALIILPTFLHRQHH